MHQQITIKINNLPLVLICLSNGHVAIIPQGKFPVIFDSPEQGVKAVITPETMLVGTTNVPYNTSLPYKEMPELLQWLVDQQLEMPAFGNMF